MKELIIEIKNDQGLHARPSARIVNLVKNHNSTLKIEYDGEIFNGNDIMDIMSIGAVKGDKLLFITDGEDEVILSEKLYQLIEVDKFFE